MVLRYLNKDVNVGGFFYIEERKEVFYLFCFSYRIMLNFYGFDFVIIR